MPLNGEINVVSLIDVMMLLMVIFMITAPMMQNGVEVSLPRADAQPLESKNAVVVTVNDQEQILVDNTLVTEEEFGRSIKLLSTRKGKEGVVVQSSKYVPMGTVVRLLAILQRNGITNVGIVTADTEMSKNR
jgi:biopolymer transport protein ExbD